MKVIFVGSGPGDPELLTRKAERLLRECHFCIYAGSLVHPAILEMLPPDAEKYDSAELALPQIIALCVQARAKNVDVIRLHSGDPSIYGATREQMNELDKLSISYEVVPGVSSFQAAAAALKTELTAPEVSQTIVLTRVAGRTPVPDAQSIENLAKTHSTLCLFLSVGGLADITPTLIRNYGADCPAAVVFHASRQDEKIIRGTVSDIAGKVQKEKISKTAMIVIGWALSREIPASKLYDEAFSHGCRTSGEK